MCITIAHGGLSLTIFFNFKPKESVVKISIAHQRDPVMGWTLKVSADGENGELIRRIKVLMNDSPIDQQDLNPPVDGWDRTYQHVGVYPGDNKADVFIEDQNHKTTSRKQQW